MTYVAVHYSRMLCCPSWELGGSSEDWITWCHVLIARVQVGFNPCTSGTLRLLYMSRYGLTLALQTLWLHLLMCVLYSFVTCLVLHNSMHFVRVHAYMIQYNNNYYFTALCPGLPGWAGTTRNTHPPTIFSADLHNILTSHPEQLIPLSLSSKEPAATACPSRFLNTSHIHFSIRQRLHQFTRPSHQWVNVPGSNRKSQPFRSLSALRSSWTQTSALAQGCAAFWLGFLHLVFA